MTIWYNMEKGGDRKQMNDGKIFENEIKNSIPEDILYYRIKDPAQGFSGGGTTRFSLHNPCDIFLFKSPYLIALELKSTKGTSLSFSLEDNNKMIKKCQVEGLKELSKYNNVTAGFLINFRRTENTYYLDISDFISFINKTSKKSINENDVICNNGYLIESKKKRKRFIYNINSLFERLKE